MRPSFHQTFGRVSWPLETHSNAIERTGARVSTYPAPSRFASLGREDSAKMPRERSIWYRAKVCVELICMYPGPCQALQLHSWDTSMVVSTASHTLPESPFQPKGPMQRRVTTRAMMQQSQSPMSTSSRSRPNLPELSVPVLRYRGSIHSLVPPVPASRKRMARMTQDPQSLTKLFSRFIARD